MLRWETVLALLLACVIVMDSLLSPYLLDFSNLIDGTFNFAEKAMIALPMTLLIISCEIDVSVASIVALAAVLLGVASSDGADVTVVVLVGLATGLVAGTVNGLLVTGLGVPMVVTIGTRSLYRGIAKAIVADGAYTKFPSELFFFGRYYFCDTRHQAVSALRSIERKRASGHRICIPHSSIALLTYQLNADAAWRDTTGRKRIAKPRVLDAGRRRYLASHAVLIRIRLALV